MFLIILFFILLSKVDCKSNAIHYPSPYIDEIEEVKSEIFKEQEAKKRPSETLVKRYKNLLKLNKDYFDKIRSESSHDQFQMKCQLR